MIRRTVLTAVAIALAAGLLLDARLTVDIWDRGFPPVHVFRSNESGGIALDPATSRDRWEYTLFLLGLGVAQLVLVVLFSRLRTARARH